nr:GDP-mannose mannosyl hydrolase [Pseudomonas guineae]
MWLTPETFRTVVASTPLVSIDLVVQNARGQILLGQRLNRPAQGFWFVPGGRILKNESLDDAFVRLTKVELGQCYERNEARFLGVYEHFYADSIFGQGQGGADTHYVVLGYLLVVGDEQLVSPPQDQHGQYRWWDMSHMLASAQVHHNTRAYLQVLG